MGLPGCTAWHRKEQAPPGSPPSTALCSSVSHSLGKDRAQLLIPEGEKQAGPALGLSAHLFPPQSLLGRGWGQTQGAPWRWSTQDTRLLLLLSLGARLDKSSQGQT